MKYKKHAILTLVLTILLLAAFAAPIVIIDPYVHYHAPLEDVSYLFDEHAYVNDGLARHLEYDTVVAGSSMMTSFSPEYIDEAFGTNTLKTPHISGTFKETGDFTNRALSYNDDLDFVIRSFDFWYMLDQEKDEFFHDTYPTYLYDNNLFNDTEYVLNKDILFLNVVETIERTQEGLPATTQYEYLKRDESEFSKEAVLDYYERDEYLEKYEEGIEVREFTEDDKQMIYDNMMQNVVALAVANPDVMFYYFVPPYSAAYYDREFLKGTFEKNFQQLEYALSLTLGYDNIKIFSFIDEYDITLNLENYRDVIHFAEDISLYIIDTMHSGDNLLTTENYIQNVYDARDFYRDYDRDSLFE